jgi:hypothetical protein
MTHAEIGDNDVGRMLCKCLQQLITVRAFADDLETGGASQAISKSDNDQRVIVRKRDADGLGWRAAVP